MALFQPTNIYPDMKGGVKNGVVFYYATGNVDVTWQVNGNSQLGAYQIDFYKNDAASTSVTTTGKITLGTPFSAIDAEGNEAQFTVQVPISTFTSCYDSTNFEGKIKITQWWNSTDNVVQRSLSVYRIGTHGSLSISGPVGYGGAYSFTGTFTASSLFGAVSLNWTRWQLFDSDGNVVQDTGKVWNATSYIWYPDQIAQGTNYYVRFSAETSFGEEIYADTATFDVLTDAVEINGGINVSCDPAAQAVKVSFMDGILLDGNFHGTYSIDYENTVINPGGNAEWAIPTDITDAPWSFIWKGKLGDGTVPTFDLTQSNGYVVSFGWDGLQQELYAYPSASFLSNFQIDFDDEYLVVFTMGATALTKNIFSWYVIQSYNGTVVLSGCGAVSSYTQAPISSVNVYNGTTEYWQILYGTANSNVIATGLLGTDCIYNGPYAAYYGAPALNGGAVFSTLGMNLTTITIFRQDQDGSIAPVSNLYLPTTPADYYIEDYTALNGHTYQYVIYYQDSANDQPTIIKSQTITPCFWSWVLIEATEGAMKNTYDILNVYLFRNNVSTSGITNGNARSVFNTFTRYPLVMKNTQNRKSGTLTGLIGAVVNGEYADTNAMMDAIYALSLSDNPLFLRNRRGEVMRISLSGEITMQTEDNSPKQQLTASVPWVEVQQSNNLSVAQGVS